MGGVASPDLWLVREENGQALNFFRVLACDFFFNRRSSVSGRKVCVVLWWLKASMSDPEVLFERLRGLDLKEQSPEELRALVHEVHGFLDEKNHALAIDLEQRVRLLRLWHVLILLGADVKNIVPPPMKAEIEPAQEPEQEAPKLEELTAPETEAEIVKHPSEPDFVAADPVPHEAYEIPTTDRTKPREVALETYGPFKPADTLGEPKRMRMQLIKEGILMNHHLPAGTIVLVYPLDGQHLIEQGVAIRLPDRDDEPHVDGVDGVEF